MPANVRFGKFGDVQLGRQTQLHIVCVSFRHIHVNAEDVDLRQLEKLLGMLPLGINAPMSTFRAVITPEKGAVTRWNDCRYFRRSTLATAAFEIGLARLVGGNVLVHFLLRYAVRFQ